MTRRVLIGGLLVALAATLAVAASALREPRHGGPLQASSRTNISFALADDQTFTWGSYLPGNSTSADIRIERVQPIGLRGVEVVRTAVAHPVLRADGVCQTVGGQLGFPPPGLTMRDAEGAILPRASGGTCENVPYVLVGARRLPGSSIGVIEALRVVYDYEGVTYEVVLPYSLTLSRP